MKQIKQFGFTLIELLVVIAIISILAGVVLVSLGGVQQGAIDSNIQQGMAGIPAAAQLHFNRTGFSYDNVCVEEINDILGNIADGAGQLEAADGSCNDGTTYWVATFDLVDGAYWCVDSDGARMSVNNPVTTNSTTEVSCGDIPSS